MKKIFMMGLWNKSPAETFSKWLPLRREISSRCFNWNEKNKKHAKQDCVYDEGPRISLTVTMMSNPSCQLDYI